MISLLDFSREIILTMIESNANSKNLEITFDHKNDNYYCKMTLMEYGHHNSFGFCLSGVRMNAICLVEMQLKIKEQIRSFMVQGFLSVNE